MNAIHETYLRGIFERRLEQERKMRNAGRVVIASALAAIGIIPAIVGALCHLFR